MLASDTGRVLMLQRALIDDDPAAGKWEFPGGHLEPGEDPLDAAKREWSEETGLKLPDGDVVGKWDSGIYYGYVWRVATEDDVLIFDDRDEVTNPDDPDGDQVEAVAWWDLAQLTGSNPALRDELRQSLAKVHGALLAGQATRKYDHWKTQPRDPSGDDGGQWTAEPGGSAVGAVKDALKLAGKIFLEPDEKLLGSAKIDGDGGIRMALTEQDGQRKLRLGIGGEGYGKANRDEGIPAWDGNPAREPLPKAEADRLDAEFDALADEYESASLARQEEISTRQADIREQLTAGDEEFSGTAKLDEYSMRRLVDKIRPALAEAVEQEKAENAAWDEIEALEAKGNPDPGRMAELRRIARADDTDFITFDEGIIPGSEWGDVHYSVELDDVTMGVTVHLGVWPKGAPDDWGDSRDWAGQFDAAEVRKFLRLLDQYVGAPQKSRNHRHLPGQHDQQSHGHWTDTPNVPGSGLWNFDEYADAYDVLDEQSTTNGFAVAALDDGGMQLVFDDEESPDGRYVLWDVDDEVDMDELDQALDELIDADAGEDRAVGVNPRTGGNALLLTRGEEDGVSIIEIGATLFSPDGKSKDPLALAIDLDEAREIIDAIRKMRPAASARQAELRDESAIDLPSEHAPPQGRAHMPTADGYIRIDELPELLRAHGLLPSPPAVEAATAPAFSAEAVRTLLGAFERDWDVKKHPKWPKGHPQGGKFRPTASVALEKLTNFHAADPFEGMSDAQVKKVAAGRGLDIPKDADRAEIVKRLRADMESKEGARTRPDGVDAKSWNTMRALATGERQSIKSDELPGLMDAIAKAKPPTFNLSRLNVEGADNENLFRKHLSSEKRKTMPQLPTETGPDLDKFEAFLRSSGINFAYGKIDPRKLTATQSELSGPKVAKLFGFMRDDGWKKGGVLIMSRDGAVLDGHHRWAGASAAGVARGGTLEVDTMVLDRDWSDALREVKPFAKFEDLSADREAANA